jgi:hypothetical protein
MKWFITGLAFLFIGTISLVFQHNYNLHQEEMHYLKFVAQESAAGAAQYFSEEKYGDGFLVYNKVEGEKAAKNIIISLLNLNSDMTPSEHTYWKQTDKITYELLYFDEDSYTFPLDYTYVHPLGTTKLTMFGPSVIVKVNVGQAKYDWLESTANNYRFGMHTFKE